jgi:RNA polymerase sigma-70 factor (ECF subfamily)
MSCGRKVFAMNSTVIFEAIVNDYYELLYRFALTLTRTETDACDLTQHTFYVWANKGHQVRDQAKVKTWLFTTLYRAFLAAKRKQLRFPHSVLLADDAEAMPDDSPTPDMQADVGQVLPALAKVDEIYQAAVALYYLNDCSYKEIAAVLEVPVGTVKSRIARGITQLRGIMNGNQFQVHSMEWDASAVHIAEPIVA